MTHAEDFCRDYQGVLDGLDLPPRISLAYEPVSLLAERDGRSVWKLRRRWTSRRLSSGRTMRSAFTTSSLIA